MRHVSVAILAASVLAFASSPSGARQGSLGWPDDHSGCAVDRLLTVSLRGDTLVMLSGHIFSVDKADVVDTRSWDSGDFVFICVGEMINKDKLNDRATVILQR